MEGFHGAAPFSARRLLVAHVRAQDAVVDVDFDLVAGAHEADRAAGRGLGRDVSEGDARRAAGEAAVGDERALLAQAQALEVGGRVEHLLHAGSSLRPLVADHHYVAGLHLAAEDALAALKAANERDLTPYRELASSAKGSLEDAERAAREARRSVKAAQAAADNAINTRDSHVQAAMRAADNAASRLQRLQDKLAELKRDPSTGAKELSEMSSGVAAALARLENARADVTRVTAETSQAADIAQTHLYTQRKSLEVLEDDLASAQADEKAKREKYNELKASADEREGEASDKVRDLASKIEEQEELATVSQGRIDAATATIEEAEDIHAHPEVTASLAERLHAAMAKTEEHKRVVANLAEEERIVRERTQHSRRIFYAAIVAAVAIVIIAILVFIMK